MKRFLPVVLGVLGILSVFSASARAQEENGPGDRKLLFFYSAACHACSEVKSRILPDIENKFKGRIIIEYHDIFDIENYKLLLNLQQKHGIKLQNTVPTCYFQGRFLSGKEQIGRELDKLITESLGKRALERPDMPVIDLVAHFRGFSPLAIAGAGLIDGINPCAFTVIVFFISFLSLQGYVKKELAAIGVCFIFSVFVTYLLIGLGAFSFLYRLSRFWLITKITNYAIGSFSIILGALALYDFYKFKRTGKTEGLSLQLPAPLKNQIHKVIGSHYRVNKSREGAVSKRRIFNLLLSALITGFLVSLLEAVCTGQTYLPTITFILKTAPLKLQALAYLLLYNLMFIMPLFVIFLFALSGVSTEQFSKLFKKHLLLIKILMMALFFSLGIFLIWRA